MSGELDAEAQSFVRVLIDNDRLALLPEIDVMFEMLKNEREGVVDAQIATAFEFQGGQLASLVADLEKRFKRKINPQVTSTRTSSAACAWWSATKSSTARCAAS